MKAKILHRLGAVLLGAVLCVTSISAERAQAASGTAGAQAIDAVLEGETDDAPGKVSRVSVHDPSIIKADGTYYVFGTHMADAKSADLMDWEQMNIDWFRRGDDSWKNDPVYGEVITNLAESFAWAGYDDGDQKNGGMGVWAPDVIYNPYYEWEDSSKGAYMLYYSASSTWRRSCIGYGVSKTVEGPYQYVGTVVYSGFTQNGQPDNGAGSGVSTRNTRWDNDYLNLKRLIEDGTLSGVSDRWFTADGGWEASYAPNAIDPCIFFDKNHDKMYMSYGSWSGGIFILELDKTTGAAQYPGKDSTDNVSGNFIDRYFGIHIAGGNHQSGEGSYIVYDPETDYYYLYVTYGGLDAAGGYNMRLFRSRNIYGPYVDATGRKAQDNRNGNEAYGIKLIGNYQFPNQPGYRAAGHNSAFIDEDGQRYLFYHQRFEMEHQTENHEVRVRRQYLNADGWPVPSVYEYRGESIGHYTDEEVAGCYDLINHGIATNGNMIVSEKLVLYADGRVGGAMSGSWARTTGEGKEYDYISLNLDGKTYKGILYKQFNEEEIPQKVMTFSVIGDDNTCLWGSGEPKRGEYASSLVYGFNFETAVSAGSISPVKRSAKKGKAALVGKASVVKDSERGNVLHVQNAQGAFGINYLRLPSDVFSDITEDGFTVSMWVNIGTDTAGESALFEANSGSEKASYPMTRVDADLSARINANTYLNGDKNKINRGEWHHLAYSAGTGGIRLYLDGKLISLSSRDLSKCFDRSLDRCIQNVENVYIGSGQIYGTEDVRDVKYDDVAVYSMELSNEQVAEIYANDTLKDDPEPVKSAQTISVKSSYNKTYKDKAFYINATLKKGNGVLRYDSDSPKVAAVNAKTGKVTIKGTGIAKITVTASETPNYKKQTKTVKIQVAPKKTSLSAVKSKSAGKAALKWKKSDKASGYRIQYATNSKFKKARNVFVSKGTAKSKTISKLKRKKTYYFRIQPYKQSGKTKVYGAYSKAKRVKIK